MARMQYVGDDVDEMLDEVSGTPSGPQRRKPLQRAKPDSLRGGFLGFGAAVGVLTLATQVFSDAVQRGFQPEWLVLVVEDAGFIVTSIKTGDVEHIVGSKGVVAEMFDKSALLSPPVDFEPAGTGVTVSVTVVNTTAGTLNAAAAFRGEVLA